eukprot:6204274-Pleurochrysis_carterae.AAC.1
MRSERNMVPMMNEDETSRNSEYGRFRALQRRCTGGFRVRPGRGQLKSKKYSSCHRSTSWNPSVERFATDARMLSSQRDASLRSRARARGCTRRQRSRPRGSSRAEQRAKVLRSRHAALLMCAAMLRVHYISRTACIVNLPHIGSLATPSETDMVKYMNMNINVHADRVHM